MLVQPGAYGHEWKRVTLKSSHELRGRYAHWGVARAIGASSRSSDAIIARGDDMGFLTHREGRKAWVSVWHALQRLRDVAKDPAARPFRPEGILVRCIPPNIRLSGVLWASQFFCYLPPLHW